MTTLSIGGRHCFWRMISGPIGRGRGRTCVSRRMGGDEALLLHYTPVDFSRMATMPTPSMSLPWGRVVRSQDSQSRTLPVGSLYVILSQAGGLFSLGDCCEMPGVKNHSLDHLRPFCLGLGLFTESWSDAIVCEVGRGEVTRCGRARLTYQMVDRDDLGVCCGHVW